MDLVGRLGRWLDACLRRPGRGGTGGGPGEHTERHGVFGGWWHESLDGLGIGVGQRLQPCGAEAEVSAVDDPLGLLHCQPYETRRGCGGRPMRPAVAALDQNGTERLLDVEP